MGYFKFRKSIKIAPGIKINFNKKSTSMTFGRKGAHYTINSKGTRTTSIGLPGTGLSYVDVKNPNKTTAKSREYQADKNDNTPHYNYSDDGNDYYNYIYQSTIPKDKPPIIKRNWFMVLMMIFVAPVGIFLMWYNKEWKTAVKVVISIILIFYSMIYCGMLF